MNRILLIICTCLVLSACGSHHYGAAKIISHPSGAEIINANDGTTLGVTPQTVWWKDNKSDRKNILLRFRKDGFYDKTDSFWLSMRHENYENAIAHPTVMEVKLRKKGE